MKRRTPVQTVTKCAQEAHKTQGKVGEVDEVLIGTLGVLRVKSHAHWMVVQVVKECEQAMKVLRLFNARI